MEGQLEYEKHEACSILSTVLSENRSVAEQKDRTSGSDEIDHPENRINYCSINADSSFTPISPSFEDVREMKAESIQPHQPDYSISAAGESQLGIRTTDIKVLYNAAGSLIPRKGSLNLDRHATASDAILAAVKLFDLKENRPEFYYLLGFRNQTGGVAVIEQHEYIADVEVEYVILCEKDTLPDIGDNHLCTSGVNSEILNRDPQPAPYELPSQTRCLLSRLDCLFYSKLNKQAGSRGFGTWFGEFVKEEAVDGCFK